MDQSEAKRILLQYHKRNLSQPKWENGSFKAQWDFITHPARLKALQCSRRAGKSYSGGLYAIKTAYEHPHSSIVILGLTRESVKRIFFKDIFKVIDRTYKLKAKFNGSELSVTLSNGSVIYLLGVDSSEDEMNKLLGQKNRLVIIDESAFFRQNMTRLVYEILKPSVADLRGTIALISTTSNITNSLYYDITNGGKAGWEVFKWTALENPFMEKVWKEEIAELKEANPLIEETPYFQRMYLNKWVVDEAGLIYRYDKFRNSTKELPKDCTYKYVLGIDLGYNDATAFVVCAYSEHDPKLYVIDTFSKTKMIVKDVAVKIHELDTMYNFDTMVVDGASKQVVEELKQRYSLPLTIAEKTDKRGHIEMLNSDLIVGNIKLTGNTDKLVTEWKALVWDEKQLNKKKYVEHPNCDNHLSDAFLYAWRWCFNYSNKPKIIVARGSEAEVEQFWLKEADRLEVEEMEEDIEADLYG